MLYVQFYLSLDHIRKEIVNSKIRKFIYSGYPGEIVKKQIIDRKNLIHCHPGRLPKFKGSTVIYYSLILTGKIFCSCIKLNSKIDEGKILIIKRFKKPKKIKTIEGKFDNKIRSMTLIAYLKSKKRKYKFSYSNKTLNYYIAHPIIRSIILNKSQLNFLKN